MKIVTKSNFNEDLFTERVVAEVINEHIGKEFVKLWNNEYCDGYSDIYLELVEDDYKLYDGYADLY